MTRKLASVGARNCFTTAGGVPKRTFQRKTSWKKAKPAPPPRGQTQAQDVPALTARDVPRLVAEDGAELKRHDSSFWDLSRCRVFVLQPLFLVEHPKRTRRRFGRGGRHEGLDRIDRNAALCWISGSITIGLLLRMLGRGGVSCTSLQDRIAGQRAIDDSRPSSPAIEKASSWIMTL